MYEALLQIIAQREGQHTWFSLDRALAGRFDVSNLLLPTLEQLTHDGLIEARGPIHMPQYWLTAKGKARVTETLRAAVA